MDTQFIDPDAFMAPLSVEEAKERILGAKNAISRIKIQLLDPERRSNVGELEYALWRLRARMAKHHKTIERRHLVHWLRRHERDEERDLLVAVLIMAQKFVNPQDGDDDDALFDELTKVVAKALEVVSLPPAATATR